MTKEEAIKKLESLKISLPAAKDEISGIINLIETPWISVKDDLPCNHEELLENENCTKKVLVVLAWNENPTQRHIDIADMCNMIGLYNVKFHWRNDGYYTVTHWMRLPELPKE